VTHLRLNQLLVLVVVLSSAAVRIHADTPGEWVKSEVPQLTQLYQSLHQAPELSFQEEKTSARMVELLREAGLTVTEDVGGHGVVGVLENGPGKTLLLRADMDALPVVEETDLPYASNVKTRDTRGATVGVMHACGHDMHMTNLVGAVRYLASHREGWQGTLVAIFQPAEELGAGAQAMIDDGLLARFPRPNFALAMHVASDRPAGMVGYRAGYACANVDSVDITIHGRGGHGAYPHTTIDPVVIAARLVLDLQTVVSREIDPIEPTVITVGSIHGGTKHNVIGDTCELQLTVRSYSPEVRKKLLEAIRRKAVAAAASADAPEPEVELSEGTPALLNDLELTERVVAALAPALGRQNVQEVPPTMGGEDFGRFGVAGVPIVMLQLGTIDQERLDQFKQTGTQPPSLHSPKYYPDPEKSIATGVATLATAALELLRPSSD
jgi:hippurate hydrolase